MAESDNMTLIGRIYEAFGRGDIGYIIDQLTDDVRWVSHLEPIVPWSGDYSGKTNVPKFFEAIANSVQTTSLPPKSSSRRLTRSFRLATTAVPSTRRARRP